MTGEAGPGRESDDHTPSPVWQMDQGSNSKISSSDESERNTKLRHKLNLPFLCETNLRLSRSATTRWCASRSPKRTWISCARGCWRRWSSRPMTQAPASPRVNGEIGARAEQRVWLLHSTGCCVYSLQGFDLTCAFLYTTPYPAWIEQNTDVYIFSSRVYGLVISGMGPFFVLTIRLSKAS